MEEIVTLFKNYFALMLVLLLFSYLAPREHYKKYVQFFIGIWLFILLLKPVYTWLEDGKKISFKSRTEIEEELKKIEKWEGEGCDVFELFYMEQTKEGTGETEK